MTYRFIRDGSPDKIRDSLLREICSHARFESMREGVIEDLAYALGAGWGYVSVRLYIDDRGAHGKIVRLDCQQNSNR